MSRPEKRRRIPVACLALFVSTWFVLAIAPVYRADWVLENLLTFFFVPALVLSYRRFQFSDRAYVQMTIFLVLHTVGSHYTYSEVPLGDWMREALGLARNHYDRIIHFSFGLLMLVPVREATMRRAHRLRSGMQGLLSFAVVTSLSVLFELIEWIVASIADPQAGIAYLGTQGDVWDAQKDMACACVGAIFALLAEPWIPRRLRT
jgi:putative membrane protein